MVLEALIRPKPEGALERGDARALSVELLGRLGVTTATAGEAVELSGGTMGRLLVKEAAAAAAERKCMWAAAAAANMLKGMHFKRK